MRVIKEHEVRKAEIVAAAWDLFRSIGYEKTTVNTILERLGIAKGTFYHYFTSKDDVLDAAAEAITAELGEQLAALVAEPSFAAVEKLNRLLTSVRRWRLDNLEGLREVMRTMYRDENIVLRHKIERRNAALVAPLFARIIEEGKAQGVFHLAGDARDAARALLAVTDYFTETNIKALLDDPATPIRWIRARVRAASEMMERMLAAPSGSLAAMDSDLLEEFCERLRLKEQPAS